MRFLATLLSIRVSRLVLTFGFLVVVWYTAASPFFAFDKIQLGGEYGVHILSFYAWEHFKTCGVCMFWENNSGGMPVFGDPYTAAQHPVVILTTIFTNPVVAGNLTVAFALALMGVSALLYAHTFKYEVVPTLWLVGMMIWGGQLITRLDIGSIGLPLSIASFTISIVLIIRWTLHPTIIRGLLVVLSVAGLGLSGQGYMQLLFLLSLVPWFLYARKIMPVRQLFMNVLVMVFTICILILPFLVSYLQYGGVMQKVGSMQLESVQPFGFYFLNLLIDQREIFGTTILSKQEFVYLYSNYVGYVTVILALIALFSVVFETNKMLIFNETDEYTSVHGEAKIVGFWVSIGVISALFVSGNLQRFIFWLDLKTINEMVASLRNIVVVGCAVAIVAIFLSGLGLRLLLARINQLGENKSSRISMHIETIKVVVYALLIWQLLSAQSYVKQYISMGNIGRDESAALKYLDEYPLGYIMIENNQQYLNVLNSKHKNVWNLFYPYYYKDSIAIVAKYRLAYSEVDPSEGWVEVNRFNDLRVYTNDTYDAAYSKLTVLREDANTYCPLSKRSVAGTVVLTCTLQQKDTLLISEYNMSGWTVTVDGKPASLYQDVFLMVDVPAGKHTITFQYLPVAVIVSAILSLVVWIGVVSVIVWLLVYQQDTILFVDEIPSSSV